MRAFAYILSLSFLTLAGPAAANDGANALAAAFCQARMPNDEAKVASLLSPSLRTVVNEAVDRNALVAESMDGKPPLGDGIPYQSFQDHAPSCTIGAVINRAGRVEAEVVYTFPDAPDSGWSDWLLLVEVGDGLAIDDIRFVTPANHTELLTLRSVLANAFDR